MTTDRAVRQLEADRPNDRVLQITTEFAMLSDAIGRTQNLFARRWR
jgi:hypothetical protein